MLCSHSSRLSASETMLDLKRASLFTIARLAEFSEVVADPLFYEKAATILTHLERALSDPISLANVMVLARNVVQFTPTMRGRIADPTALSVLANLLLSADQNLSRLGADVLTHALYFEKPKVRHATRAEVNQRTAPGPPSLELRDSKLSVADVRRVMMPGWKLLFAASICSPVTEDDEEMTLLTQELDDVCELMQMTTRGQLLRLLIELHLCLAETRADSLPARESDNFEDVIADRELRLAPTKSGCLQYVLPGVFRSSPDSYDRSFLGSARLWHFVRTLWRVCRSADAAFDTRVLSTASLAHIGTVLSRWKEQRDVRHSTLATKRRARFLRFIVVVVEAVPTSHVSSAVRSDLIGVADLFFENEVVPGVAYELLYTLCCQDPSSVEQVLQQFTRGTESFSVQMTTSFANFVRGIRLEYLAVRVCASKIKGQETESAVTLLDPRVPSAPAIAYAVGLLNLLSVRLPAVVSWLIECQGVQTLLDLVLLDTAFTSALPPNIRASFASSLLELLGRVLTDHPVTKQAVEADARVLIRIVSFVYALQSHTQLAALELIRVLAVSPPIRAMLVQLELEISSTRMVDSSVNETLQVRLSELQVSPPPRLRDVVELAHLLQVPLFADLTTAELVRLSLGFVESRLLDEEAFMILAADGHFSAVPSWMLSSSDDSTRVLPVANQINRIGIAFQTATTALAADGPLMVYKLQREGYYRCTTRLVRKRVAKRAAKLRCYSDNTAVGQRAPAHTTGGLLARLCRFLVEDRAELVRRVVFSSQRAEQDVLRKVCAKQLSDVMNLLSLAPLFSSVSRDALARAAYSLEAPRLVTLGDSNLCEPDSMWLVLSENWRVTITNDNSYESDTGSVRVEIGRRGSLIGHPEWLFGAFASQFRLRFPTHTHLVAVYAVEVTRHDLLAALGESTTLEIADICQQAVKSGGLEAFLAMTAAPKASDTPHASRPVSMLRPTHQIAALQLLKLLAADRDMALMLVANAWATRILIEVTVSALPSTLVSLALDIVKALANDQVVCSKFLELEAKDVGVEVSSGAEKDRGGTEGKVPAVVGLLRQFSVRQWATNASVLRRFFALQYCVFENVLSAAETISQTWTSAYFDACQFVLQQDQLSGFQTAEVAAAHFVRAIPRHNDLVKQRGRASSLHLEALHVLLRAPEPIRCANVMALACFLCADSYSVWTQVEVSADSFDQVLQTLATDLEMMSKAPDAPRTLCGDEDPHMLIRSYCAFVELICSSQVDEVRDGAIRERLELRFSVLSALLRLLSQFDNHHDVRCCRVTGRR